MARAEADPAFSLEAASAGDLEALVALRARAMRESLERIGRFDPARGRARFTREYQPEHTRLIRVDGALVGCVALSPRAPGRLLLQHFYLEPAHSGRGLGAAVMDILMAEADAARDAVEITVVHGSRAHAFYARYGFERTGADETDVFYLRPARPASA